MQKIRKNTDIIASTMKNMDDITVGVKNWAANVDGRDNKGDVPGLNITIE